MNDVIQVYDSQGKAYHDAFAVFLQHTDQKLKAREWLDRLVQSLPRRRVFIDPGAGNGQVTAWFIEAFERTLAIEPNESLRNELRKQCPAIETLGGTILGANPAEPGDLILCSHVFYYIEEAEWLPHLERLASWLSPEGVLVVVLQNPQTDCMKMVEHFHGRRFDLSALAGQFESQQAGKFLVTMDTVASEIVTEDLKSAYTIAEFMLNLLPMREPPQRRALESYVGRFLVPTMDVYAYSCHQDFLQIRRAEARNRSGGSS
jgi:SAM-dependent methyltransferase